MKLYGRGFVETKPILTTVHAAIFHDNIFIEHILELAFSAWFLLSRHLNDMVSTRPSRWTPTVGGTAFSGSLATSICFI